MIHSTPSPSLLPLRALRASAGSFHPLALAVALAAAGAAPAGEAVLTVPFEVRCGDASPVPGGPSAAGAPRLLPDLPFESSRGYGHVGGEAGALSAASRQGLDPLAPSTWREGMKKYVFRVPNGEYLVRIRSFETEVAEAGLRTFDVLVGERKLFAGIDPAGEAGDFESLEREGLVTVRDGWLDLGFAAAGSRSPRIATVGIEAAEGIPFSPEPPARVSAEPGPRRVILRWSPSPSMGIAGYGIFRSDAIDGPYESLTVLPISARRFIDERRPTGVDSFYRVRAYGVRGGQSPLTAPLAARPGGHPQGLKVFDLSLGDAELKALYARSGSPAAVRGALNSGGASYPVEISCQVEDGLWRSKKSYRLRVEGGGRRALLGRAEIHLFAEAGDPTLIREKLARELDRAAGLASPEAVHVHLLVNGRYQGVYVDREPLSGSFRRRANLDRFGTLAAVPGRLLLERSWRPYGNSRNQSGDQMDLTRFIHELNRLDDADLDSWFEERFYLDRLLDRMALDAIRGVDPQNALAAPPGYFLDDSRNGKIELFEERSGSGELGIEDFKALADAADPARARRALLSWSLQGEDGAAAGRSRLLETRLLSRPAIRDRYLARVEKLLRETFAPEKFDALVEAARGPLEKALLPTGAGGAAPQDISLWPPDGGAAFRGAPAALGRLFRSHRENLLSAIAAEKARAPDPLCLNEVCLRPKGPFPIAGLPEGAPWAEVLNRSGTTVDLGAYSLRTDPLRSKGLDLPAVSIPPGAMVLLVFSALPDPAAGAGAPDGRLVFCGPLPSSVGFSLGLFLRTPAVLADLALGGRPTAGFAGARLPDGGPGWANVASPTPLEPNAGPPVAPPPWKYRSGVEPGRSGEQRIWLQVFGPVEEATVNIRDEGLSSFIPEAMSLNAETHRYEIVLGKDRLARPFEYHFTVRAPGGLERTYPLPGPELPLRHSVRPQIFLNEVLPRPRREGPQREFVEIYNASGEPVSVDGMFFTDTRRNPTKFRISHPEPIPPKGFLVLLADGRGEGIRMNFRLGNAGEYLGLFGRAEEGNLLIDQVAFPAVAVDKSYGREQEGAKGWKVWKDPTPGTRNLPKIPPEFLKKAREKEAAAPSGAETEIPEVVPEGSENPDEDEDEGEDG